MGMALKTGVLETHLPNIIKTKTFHTDPEALQFFWLETNTTMMPFCMVEKTILAALLELSMVALAVFVK